MGKHALLDVVHEMKMVVVRMTDKQLVKVYEQSETATDSMFDCGEEVNFAYKCVMRELINRHPRRWRRFVESDEPASALRKYYIKD